jgi:hypothetical protein
VKLDVLFHLPFFTHEAITTKNYTGRTKFVVIFRNPKSQNSIMRLRIGYCNEKHGMLVLVIFAHKDIAFMFGLTCL